MNELLTDPTIDPGDVKQQQEEDRQNINFFLDEALGAERDKLEQDPWAVKLVVQVNLDLNRESPKDRTFLKEAGIPGSKKERNIVNEDPLKRFEKAPAGIDGARRGVYKTIRGYLYDASTNIAALQNVQDDSPARRVDLARLKDDRRSKYLLADMLFDRERFNNQAWPNKNTDKYKNRQRFWRGLVLVATSLDGHPNIEPTANELLGLAYQRVTYWTEKFGKLSRTPGGIVVAKELLGPESSESQEIGTFKHVTQIPITIVEGEPPQTLGSLEMPEDIHRELVSDYAARQEKITRQVRRGKPQITAEMDVLGGPGIYDSNGNLIGFDPSLKTEKPSTAALVRYELERKAARDRRRAKLR